MNETDRSPDADESTPTDTLSRRTVISAAAGTGALSLGAGTIAGSVGAQEASEGIPTPWLEVDGNLVKDPQGNTVTLRGVNIADPRRMNEDVSGRGKSAAQAVDYLTNEAKGWYSRLIRIPCQPWDIAGLPSPWSAHHYDDVDPEGYVDREDGVGYYEPPTMTQAQLETYLEEHLDPVVESCRRNGVYCIVDFHRHWGGGELEWADPDTGEPNQGLDDEVRLFWETVAPRYAEASHVLYEVYNEPTEPGMWGDPTEKDWVADRWQWWKDMAQPWVDIIREHAPRNLVLIGSPSWTQSPEGALVEPFEGENLAYTYHIYPKHEASKQQAWDGPGPNGDGTKKIYEEYPLFVTEWGWSASDLGTDIISSYADPMAEWLESSDAIHWQAWNFDAGWASEISVRPAFDGECTDPPCEWEVVPHEDSMGNYVKDLLAEHKDDGVPAGEGTGETISIGEYEARDPDGDGLYDDVDGDGQTTHADVDAFYEHLEADGVRDNPDAFDFDGNGRVGFSDVLDLLRRI
ncbi:cellulase family glycosylhydrolase [Natrinema salaciae]|uniref:Aryl-phospho-beta-D-glucosidase BglC, GH1 family n=1 Tax=Natrinema salaciae TaxID=1186196 RepID=A0A1H9IFF6_9EURY|nr:cellulase family glycosylhydrolase [Natrinema salaciae]SEQ73461.1 Aryl-phospho-beta-D-glucosidase BglC, GH1 family [Natrinema salaciae]